MVISIDNAISFIIFIGGVMTIELTWSDAEKLLREMLQIWHDVDSSCIDWKQKTSRKSRYKQDMFGVFDAMVNDKNHVTLGYQFKYYKKDISPGKLKAWAEKVKKTNFDVNNAILVVIIKGTDTMKFYYAANYV